MVWCINFFFAYVNNIHKKYGKFYESDDDATKDGEEGDEDTTKMGATEAAARFYFELTFQLAQGDITKIDSLNNLNMYLCLNAASLLKDRVIQEQNELKKLERKTQLK